MKKKEKTSFRSMTVAELDKVITESQSKLAAFMINRYSKQSKNVHEGRALRSKLAVVMTAKRMKEFNHE